MLLRICRKGSHATVVLFEPALPVLHWVDHVMMNRWQTSLAIINNDNDQDYNFWKKPLSEYHPSGVGVWKAPSLSCIFGIGAKINNHMHTQPYNPILWRREKRQHLPIPQSTLFSRLAGPHIHAAVHLAKIFRQAGLYLCAEGCLVVSKVYVVHILRKARVNSWRTHGRTQMIAAT